MIKAMLMSFTTKPYKMTPKGRLESGIPTHGPRLASVMLQCQYLQVAVCLVCRGREMNFVKEESISVLPNHLCHILIEEQ